MSKVKKDAKDRDEIETYFADAKKKSFPIGIIFFLLIFILIGGIAYYYFFIDSPKNIFLTIINDKLSETKTEEYEKLSIDFNLDANMISTDKDVVDILNILNKISISGNLSEDLSNRKAYLKLNALYEENDLLGIDAYYEKTSIYLKLNNLYDKILKTELSEEEQKEMNDSLKNNDQELINKLINSITKNLNEILKSAEYKKEYVKLNKEYVKKLTLTISGKLSKEFYTKLIDDKDFIESYSKLLEISKKDLEENLQKEIDNIDTNAKLTIDLYLSIIKNKFNSLEITNDDKRLTINKENDEYKYKCYESDIVKFQGYTSLVKNNEKEYELFFYIDDIENQLNIEINLDLLVEYNTEIDKLDTTNSIDIDSLTDEDINKIMTNITNNKNLNKLITDLNTLVATEQSENNNNVM